MLTFDAALHKYEFDGVLIPSVTAVLSDLTSYAMVAPDKLEIARQKGTAVHSMINLWATGDLGERTEQPAWMWPCLDEFLKFATESGLEIIGSEQQVFHPIFGFAGTWDIKCRMRGMEGIGIIDVKRSFLAADAIGIQLAAYMEAENYMTDGEPVEWRAALKINENHRYRLEPYDNPNDWSVFLACLVRYKWLMERKKS